MYVRSHEKCRSLTKAVGASHEGVGISQSLSDQFGGGAIMGDCRRAHSSDHGSCQARVHVHVAGLAADSFEGAE